MEASEQAFAASPGFELRLKVEAGRVQEVRDRPHRQGCRWGREPRRSLRVSDSLAREDFWSER
ncbi:MAG: hypothetical protein ACPLQP_12025, partial [Moorellaceae bacterium]